MPDLSDFALASTVAAILGIALGVGVVVAVDVANDSAERAFALFERAAEADLGAAVTKLGDFYLFGAAPSGRDVDRAVAQFEQSTALGDAAAARAIHPDRMHLVDIGHRLVLVGDIADLGDGSDIAVHRVRARLAVNTDRAGDKALRAHHVRCAARVNNTPRVWQVLH